MGNSHSEQEQQPEKSLGRGDTEKGKAKEAEKTTTKGSTPKLLNPVPPSQFKGIPDFTVNMGQASLCSMQATPSLSSLSTESPMSMQAVPTSSATPSSPFWHTPISPPHPSQTMSLPKPQPQGPSLQEAALAPNPQPAQQRLAPVAPNPQPTQQRLAAVAPNPQPTQQRLAAVAPNPQPTQQRLAPVAPNPQPTQQRLAPVAPNPQPTQQRLAPVAPNPQPTQQRLAAVKAVIKASLRSPQNPATPTAPAKTQPTAKTQPAPTIPAKTQQDPPPQNITAMSPLIPDTAPKSPQIRISQPDGTRITLDELKSKLRTLCGDTSGSTGTSGSIENRKSVPISPPMVVTKPHRRSRRPDGTSTTLHKRKDGLPENKKSSTPSGDTGNNKGTINSTENKQKPTGSLKVPPNFVLSKKILKKIEHRMEYMKKQESLPPPPSPLRQAAVRAALNGVPFIEAIKTSTPKVKPAHREAKAQKAKTSKSDYNFNTTTQTIQPACQPQNNPEPASKPDKPAVPNAASLVPNNLSFSLGTTTPSAQTQKEKQSKAQPQTKAAPEAQGAGSTSTSCTTSVTGKPAGIGTSSRLTFSPNSVSGRAQAARLRLKQMREDRSRAQPAEDGSRAQPAEGSREDRSRAQPADGGRENHLSTEPLRASHRAPVQPPPRPLTPGPAPSSTRPLTPGPAPSSTRPLTPTPTLSQYRGPITTKQGQKPSRGQPEARPTTEGKKQPEVKPSTGGKKQPEVKPSTEGKKQPEVKPSTGGKKQPEVKPSTEGKKQPEVKPSIGGKTQPEVKPSTEGKSPQQQQEGVREASGVTRTHYTNWYVSNTQLPSFTEPMVAEATQPMDRYQKYANEFHYPDGRGVVDFSKFSMSTTLGGKVTVREVDDPTEVDTAFEEWYSGINPFTPKTTTTTAAAVPTTQLPQASDSKPPPDTPAKAPPAQSRKKQTRAVAQSGREEQVKTKDAKKEETIEDIPSASPLTPKCPPRPSGCWHPFTVDRSCSRQARCQHRATNAALPSNVTKWLNVSRNYLCEPPWVTTATLAASLALRERRETR